MMPDTELKGDSTDLLRIVLPAAARGDLKSVKRFVRKDPWWVFRIGPHGRTMLWEAAYKNRIETVRYLIERGANVNALGTYYTPLRVDLSPYAVARLAGNDELMELLAESGALFDLHSAAYFGEIDQVKKFLKQNRKHLNAEADIFTGDPVQLKDVALNKKLTSAIARVERNIDNVFKESTNFVHEQLKSKRVINSQKNLLCMGIGTEFGEA